MKRFAFLLALFLLNILAVKGSPDSLYNVYIKQAEKFYDLKVYQRSAEIYSAAFALLGNKGTENDRYNAACSWALTGNVDSAYTNLFIIAEKTGYSNLNHFLNDTDLEIIRKDKRYERLLKIIKANKEKAEANLDKGLVKLLDSVLYYDQKYRSQIEKVENQYGRKSKEWDELAKKITHHDSVNEKTVTDILDKHGWLGPDVVGANGNTALFLVIQHADIGVQQKYLPMMREAVKNKKAKPSSLALLEDRVALGTGGKQIYGSQVNRDDNGVYYVMELEDPEHVDERRAQVGLPPLGEYTMRWGFKWDVEAYRKQIEAIKNKKK